MLSLKGNQSTLHADIQLFLSTELEKKLKGRKNKLIDSYEEFDKGHGRIEQRICYVTNQLDWLKQKPQWCDLKTIAMLKSVVTIGDNSTEEIRYFISSLAPNAKEIANAIRSHWAIENSLHWVLDLTLGEDNSRVRKDPAPENIAMIRHIILNLLQKAKSYFRKDMSLKGLQKKAGWGDSTLDLILMQNF